MFLKWGIYSPLPSLLGIPTHICGFDTLCRSVGWFYSDHHSPLTHAIFIVPSQNTLCPILLNGGEGQDLHLRSLLVIASIPV